MQEENPFLVGAERPPTSEARYFRVVRPEPDKPLLVTFTNNAIWCYWTHPVLGATQKDFRTKPCYGEVECEPELHKLPSRWWGFCAAVREPSQEIVVVQLSLRAAELVAEWAFKAKMLRGLTVQIGKHNNYVKGAFVVTRGDRWTRTALAPPVPISDSLKRLWKVDRLPTFTDETLWLDGEAVA